MIRAYQINARQGDGLIVLRGADFDRLVAAAGMRTTIAKPRGLDAPRLEDFPPEVEDHLDTEIIVQ